VERRVGLTIRQRAHFTNIYAPLCPDCGQVAESKKGLQTHLAMVHGKRLAHYKLRETPGGPSYVSRPLNMESLNLDRKLLNEYLSDMKRVWRLSGVGHSDLILVERMTRKPQKEEALYAICLAIVTRGLEDAITTAAKHMRRVTKYASHHAELVRRIQQQQRYLRLKTPEAKARLLSIGLANPTICLTYAERAKAMRRAFNKRERAIHYAN
jgi:hypothetical protein